jgi:hypothetical protein
MIFLQVFQFSCAYFTPSHQDDFPLLFIWNLFCGAKYPKPLGKIASKFNNEYVTYMKSNQAKSTMGDSFSNGLIIRKEYGHFSEH